MYQEVNDTQVTSDCSLMPGISSVQYSHDETSDEDELAVTGHSVSPEEAAEMLEELRHEDRREEGEPEEIQKEDLPSQPPPMDAKPREGELGKILILNKKIMTES